jgi:diguanylate cyclase (GGDEF)-like protein
VQASLQIVAATLLAGVLVASLGVSWRRSGLSLMDSVRLFLSPPRYARETDQLQAGLLTAFIQGLFVLVLFLTPLVAFLRRDELPATYLALGAWANLINAALYLLARRRLQLAAWLFPLSLFGMVSLALVSGVGQVGMAPYLLVIVCAGLLLGGRGAMVYALLSSLAISGAYYAAGQGWLGLVASPSALVVWVMFTSVFAVIAQWLGMAHRRIREGSRRSTELQLTQADRNRELNERLRLERQRAGQLELLAASARHLAGLTDVQTLLDQATRQLVEAHSFDEASIYLVEANELVLRSAYGSHVLGRLEGTRLPLSSGPAGRAAMLGETQRVQAVVGVAHAPANGASQGSQVCVPLRLAKSVVGVLDVSTAGSAPIEQLDIEPLESLADLIVAGLQTSGLFEQLRRQVTELSLLNDITRLSLETEDLDPLLTALADQMGQLFGADGSYLALWNEADQALERIVASRGLRDGRDAVEWLPRPHGLSLTEAALRSGNVLAVPNLRESPYAPQAPEPGVDIESMLSVPLVAGGHWLGAAHVVYRKPHHFLDDELIYAGRAGRQVALAISRARAWHAERRRNAELETLRQASLHVTSSLDPREVLEAILQQTLQLSGAHNSHIFLYDGQNLEFGAAMGAAGERTTQFTQPRAGGLTESVARTAQRIVVPDVDIHPLFQHWQWGGAIIGLPLRMGSRVCGVMNVAFQRPRRFDEHELRVLELLADQAAVALDNARLFEAEREQRSLAEALRRVSISLSSTLEYEALLTRLLEQIESVLPFDAAAILIASPGSERVQVARSLVRGQPDSAPGALQVGQEYEIEAVASLRQMSTSLQPIVVADIGALTQAGDFAGLKHLPAWAGVPVAAHQQVMAFFVIQKAEAGFYRPEHGDRLLAFAAQAALALQNARLFEAERRRAGQLALLSEVSQQLASTLDEAQLLQGAVGAMVHQLGFAEAAILLPEAVDELKVVAIAKTIPMAANVGFTQKLGAGVIGQAALRRATYFTNDIRRDPYYFDPAGRSVGSAIALPLMREGVLLGILYVESPVTGAFAAPDVVAFETLASHIATALQNARLYFHASTQLREMTALQSVSKTIVSSLEPGRIINTVVELLHDTFGYRYVSLYVLWEGRLQLQSQVGYPPDTIIYSIPLGQGVAGRAVRTRETQFVRDVNADPDFLRASDAVQSEICVPLVKDREVLGILNIESAPGSELTDADAHLLMTLGSQVTVALDNARLYEAQREQREFSEALRRASLALTATLDLDTLLDQLLEEIEAVVPYDAASILLVEGRLAVMARRRGYDQFGDAVAEGMVKVSLEIANTPNLAQMAASGQPLIVADTAQDSGWVAVAASPHLRSWAGSPALAQGQVLAYFSLNKREPDFYRPAHAARLAAFAGQAALALQNAQLFADQRRRNEEQQLLLAAEKDFSAALSEPAVLQAIARHMTAILRCAGCTLSLWDHAEDAVYTIQDYAVAPWPEVESRGARFALADYPATRFVLEARVPIVIDVNDSEADTAERALLAERGHGARLMLPLAAGEQVFGLVELHRAAGEAPFGQTDVHLAQNLSGQAGIALENARLHSAVQENVRELDALLKANEALLSTLELDQLLHNILAAAIQAIPNAEMGTVILADVTTQMLRVRAAYGYSDPRIQTMAFPWDMGYSGKALSENRPLLLGDSRAEEHPLPFTDVNESLSVRSAIVAPLVPKGSSGRPHGVISLDATKLAAFSPADLRILVAFANTAAAAIDNARLHAEVQRLAVTDSLTGLANPRAFEHALATEAHRAGRYGHPLSLIIMDIDSFKNYNDAYGHLAGNERLKAIAGLLHETVRDPDLPARYGGEEFALLLPHTGKVGAVSLAERIREAAQAAAPLPAVDGVPVSGYTLSLGVATFPVDALSAQHLLLAADNAELAAKRSGKNRVCAAPALALAPV